MSVKSAYTSKIKKSISEINQKDWTEVVANRNIYLSVAYLQSLEKSMNEDMTLFYSVVYDSDRKPVLVVAFQLVSFEYCGGNHPHIFKHFSNEKTEEGFNMKTLVCGNVFSDGENGFLWNDSISDADAIGQMTKIADEIKKDPSVKKQLSIILFKEFFPGSEPYADLLKDHSYKDFMIDVNMVLEMHDTWKTMDDYLESMTTKFRTRAKGVFKKSAQLELKSLSAKEIEEQHDRINELFSKVVAKSNYNLGTMMPDTFGALKASLGDHFSFRGIFLKEELVGFSTSFIHKGIIEANYVGMDYEHNKDMAIYQRLLYDYVEQALALNAKELQLGRTSELIKSCLGAKPVNMKLYAKHKKPVTNILLSTVLSFLSPSKFELRKPFKANFPN
ncbi:MAG: hypothetical protein P8M61_09660 [Crocinitomicaceae bacterium]|nr:hypothetical protein [Crocinitomicaceae bacterium]